MLLVALLVVCWRVCVLACWRAGVLACCLSARVMFCLCCILLALLSAGAAVCVWFGLGAATARGSRPLGQCASFTTLGPRWRRRRSPDGRPAGYVASLHFTLRWRPNGPRSHSPSLALAPVACFVLITFVLGGLSAHPCPCCAFTHDRWLTACTWVVWRTLWMWSPSCSTMSSQC